jgi:hypothetical protein
VNDPREDGSSDTRVVASTTDDQSYEDAMSPAMRDLILRFAAADAEPAVEHTEAADATATSARRGRRALSSPARKR